MATIRDKLLASAQRHVDKGNLARAVRDYNKLLDVQPDDTRTRLRIGDLQARMGKKDDAIRTYEHVAGDYSEQGFFLKAVAILKQILRLNPERTDVQVRLAELYLKLNLLSDCVAQYRKVADAFREAGKDQRYIDVLRRMSEIDPEDVRVQITLAEYFAELDRIEEAGEHFRLAAEGLAHQERWEEFVKVSERYIFHRQDDLSAIKELVRVYIERRDFKRALAKLQLAFKVDQSDVESLDLLARAFLGLGRDEKALRVLKELADILMADGREDDAFDTYQRILDIEPYDLDARVKLGLSMPSGIPLTETAEEAVPEAASDLRLEGSKPIRITDLPSEGRDQWRRLKAQSGLFATPTGLFTCNSSVSDIALEEIGRLIVEIDGFEKLGLIERARAALKRVFELDPLNISAMERAVRIDLARGNVEGAIQRLLRMTRLCWRPDPVRAAGYLNEALKQDPDHPSALQLRGELGLDGIDLETFMLETSSAEVIEVGDISGLGDSVLPLSNPGGADFVYEVADTFGTEASEDVFIQVESDGEQREESIVFLGEEARFAPPVDDDQLVELDEIDEIELDDGIVLDEDISLETEEDEPSGGWVGFSPPPGTVPKEKPPRVDVADVELYEIELDDDLGLDDDLFLEPDEPHDDLSDTDHGGMLGAKPDLGAIAADDPAELLSAALAGETRPAVSRSEPMRDPLFERTLEEEPSARQPEPAQPHVWRGTPKSTEHKIPDAATEDGEGLTPLPQGLPEALTDDLEELTFFMKAGMRGEAQTLLFDLTTAHPEHTVLIMERMAELEALADRSG